MPDARCAEHQNKGRNTPHRRKYDTLDVHRTRERQVDGRARRGESGATIRDSLLLSPNKLAQVTLPCIPGSDDVDTVIPKARPLQGCCGVRGAPFFHALSGPAPYRRLLCLFPGPDPEPAPTSGQKGG